MLYIMTLKTVAPVLVGGQIGLHSILSSRALQP